MFRGCLIVDHYISNMVNPLNGNDDARKKRGSRQVVESGPASYGRDENPKKLRSRGERTRKHEERQEMMPSAAGANPEIITKMEDRKDCVQLGEETSKAASHSTSWDLESALHHVVGLGDGCRELLSDDICVSFRVGHVGDASALVKCYRNMLKSDENKACEDSSVVPSDADSSANKSFSSTQEQMEVRLADGLGDEDNPPSIFALLAEIQSGDASALKKLSAAALFVADESAAVIRVEWFYIDETLSSQIASILERRMWLRLSMLSVLMSYEIIAEPRRETVQEKTSKN